MVKHPWPLLEISLSDFRRLATLNIIPTYLPSHLHRMVVLVCSLKILLLPIQELI